MREKIILDIIKSKENVNKKIIMTKLSISDRTVRSEINMINKSGEKNGFQIVNIRGKGYSLKINDSEIFEKYEQKLNELYLCDCNLGLEERVNKILEILLVSNDYITIEYLTDSVGYSRSTLVKDLDEVEKKLKKLNLNLKRKANSGIKIISDEMTIRKSLSTYLYSENRNMIIENDENMNVFFMVKKIFIEAIVKNKINISNVAIENVFCHLKILILRFKNKNFIKNKEDIKCPDDKFYEISSIICNFISEKCNVQIPNHEVDYLASQIFYKSRIVMQDKEIKDKVFNDVCDILQNIDNRMYTNFCSDDELKTNLLMHLCALITRARNNTQLKNPYFDEVNIRYSAIVSIAVGFIDEFCERWNLILLKDEIAFIVIHFVTHFEKVRLKKLKNIKKVAIVCPSDGGIGYFIKLRLEENFRNTILDTYSYLEIPSIKDVDYDFVIADSRVHDEIRGMVVAPIFEINNLFDDKELDTIIKKIENDINSKINLNEEKLDSLIFAKQKGGNKVYYKNFLKEESEKLTSLNIVPSNFEELVLHRENFMSTAYKNNIAAPHAIEMNAYKNCLSVTVFDKPIKWGEENISIVIFIAIKKQSLNLHRKIADKIFELVENDDKRLEIINCKSEEEFTYKFIL